MTTQRSFLNAATACLLGLAALAAAPLARADNVYWSAGIAAAPGVVVNAGNVPPAVVYATPAPAYYYPQPVYTPPRVVYTAPVYYGPAPVYMPPGYWHHHHHGGGHWRH